MHTQQKFKTPRAWDPDEEGQHFAKLYDSTTQRSEAMRRAASAALQPSTRCLHQSCKTRSDERS